MTGVEPEENSVNVGGENDIESITAAPELYNIAAEAEALIRLWAYQGEAPPLDSPYLQELLSNLQIVIAKAENDRQLVTVLPELYNLTVEAEALIRLWVSGEEAPLPDSPYLQEFVSQMRTELDRDENDFQILDLRLSLERMRAAIHAYESASETLPEFEDDEVAEALEGPLQAA